MSQAVVILLVLALVAANLPFLVERVFFVWRPRSGGKGLVWRLIELVVLYFVIGGLAYFVEGRFGPVQPQNWEFYAVTACLFLVFAFPGFVYRYLWRK
jgi:uncharacterized membrane protein